MPCHWYSLLEIKNSILRVLTPYEAKLLDEIPFMEERLSLEAEQKFDELMHKLDVIVDRLSDDNKDVQLSFKNVFRSTEVAQENDLCFVLMPFNDENLQVVYEDFIKPTVEEHLNLRCQRADDIFGANVIVDDIWERICKARIIIAELTGRNANVLYEVGLCHAIGRDVIFLTQSIEDVPFDLRHRRVIVYEYSPRGCKKLEKDLISNIRAILDENE